MSVAEADIIKNLAQFVAENNILQIREVLKELHPADIAEHLLEFPLDEQVFILNCIDNEISANVLLELDEDERKELLKYFSAKEIAEDVINEMDSDDAADVIAELSDDKKSDVIAQLEDEEHAKSIVDLLKYNENTAGGIMAKEMIKLNQDLSVLSAVKEMRKQAEELEEVYLIYVVDDKEKLLGLLNLKKLLTTSTTSKLEAVYNPKIYKVEVNDSTDSVAKMMQKYDLFEVPVVDELNRLVGRITIDDVLDIITDEAEKDYQMASGISQDVSFQDSLVDITKARLPWLLIGMVIEIIASYILKDNQSINKIYPTLFIFVPLLSATAGNIGVQSSAIIVQGLANGTLKTLTQKYLIKEISVALLSGSIISLFIFFFHLLQYEEPLVAFAISFALLFVILFAASLGTLMPIILNKNKIDPAIATGPFITTMNDVFGIMLYFFIAKLILGL